jgi:biopolymer transport protein ExbD
VGETKLFEVRSGQQNLVSKPLDFNKLTNYLQQGRISGDDGVRQVGQKNWILIKDVPALAAYLPRSASVSAEDEAEALEPIDLGLSPPRRGDSEEDDPDMIPLIDISLVLLVFFMLTAAEMITASPVETPPAMHARVIKRRESFNVNVAFENSQPVFFLDAPNERRFTKAEMPEFLNHVASQIPSEGVETTIVRAHARVPYETIQALIAGLDSKGLSHIEAGVRDHRSSER